MQPVPRTAAPALTGEDRAYWYEATIKGIVHAVRGHWILLAHNLYTFQEERMWVPLGYGTFEDWLASPEVDIERRWVYQLISTWRDLVVVGGLDPDTLEGLEPSKVQQVLPAVRRGQVTLEEGLSDAGTLSRNDLRERYRQAPDTTTSYDPAAEPEHAICPACGSRYRLASA